MRAPADMEVIQIEITNACIHSCSNCTRFCGHHKKPFFMDWETFKRSVDSLEGYTGIIGIMGGEPTLHPQFERFTQYLRERFAMRVNPKAARRPMTNFLEYTRVKHNSNRVLNKCSGPGLWTAMTKHYYNYFELIQDTFMFQSLNDHYNPSYHQPLLLTRKELGIGDDEWVKLRDKCWIQNCWSASISPKGAFFCEVAAALDMLFDGPGGWPIEPGWWKRQPEDFQDQLHWCEMCGAAVQTIRRNANEEIDDVSPQMAEKLKEIGSPKLKQGSINIYTPGQENPEIRDLKLASNEYIKDFAKRLGEKNVNLYPKGFEGIVVCETKSDLNGLKKTIANNALQLNSITIVVAQHDMEQQVQELIQDKENANILYSEGFNFGQRINYAMDRVKQKDWIVLMSPELELANSFRGRISKLFLNPGSFHAYSFNSHQQVNAAGSLVSNSAQLEAGTLILFNKKALALRQTGYDRIAKCNNLEEFKNLWPQDKQIVITDSIDEQPITDEQLWKTMVDEDFKKDFDFKSHLATVMQQALPDKGRLLVTQSASYFLTRAMIILLLEMDFDVHVMTHERFEEHFSDLLSQEKIYKFNQVEAFQFAELQEFCDSILQNGKFDGAVVLYSVPRKIIEPEDGYQEVEKVAEYLSKQIVARVNLKRQFISSVKNPQISVINQWKY
jgi:hypothetical protein